MAEDTKPEEIVDPEPEVAQDEKAKLREKNRLKKRVSRAKAKVKKQAEKQAQEAKAHEAKLKTMLNETWWKLSRDRDLTKTQCNLYAERETAVVDLEVEMENAIFSRLDRINSESRRDEYRERLQRYLAEGLVEAADLDLSEHQIQDLRKRVEADVAQHDTKLDGLHFDFASMREHFESWCQGDKGATRIFIVYGYITAIGSQQYIDFCVATAQGGHVLRCSCGETKRVQDQSEVVQHWRCFKCAERDQKQADVNLTLDKIREKAIREPDNIRPFDAYGRPYDGGKP